MTKNIQLQVLEQDSQRTSDWDRHMSNDDICYDMRNGKLILHGINNTNLAQDTAKFLTGGIYTKIKLLLD